MEKNSQKILERIAEKHQITLKEAIEKLDKCFKKVAIENNISINKVIERFYDYLKKDISKYCKNLSFSECQNVSFCTYYNEKCIPIFVKNYKEINEDPEEYIELLSTEQLKALRDLASHLYYNVGDSGLTDNAFDAIEYHLRKRLKKIYEKDEAIGSIPIEKLRVDLPFPMPSLDKIKPDQKEFSEFLINAPSLGIVWSDKLDGVSALIIYDNGEPINLYTRGNGIIGGDISYLIDMMNLPRNIDHKELLAVRGELVIKRKTFQEKYRNIYTTPRSFVVSQTNKGFITQSISDVDFVAYEIISYGDENRHNHYNPIEDLSYLEMQEFTTVKYDVFPKNVLMITVTLTYKGRREDSEYDIDGLVLDYNFSRVNHLANTNPEYKKALKMQFEEQIRSSVVLDVEWDISRYGRYNPVAIYKPVYIDNIRLTRATAHNASHIRDWNMGVGTIVKVIRSGDIIPQIKDVTINPNTIPIFPSDKYKWHWENKDIILDDIDSNPRVQQKRILHFLEVIQVVGIGEKTVEKIYNYGIKTINELIRTEPSKLMCISGIGSVTANKIKNNLKEAMSKVPLDRFLIAFTVNKFNISRKIVKDVFRTFPDIMDKERTSKEIEKILKTKKIKGVGPKRFEMIAEQFPMFRKLLMNLDTNAVQLAMKYQKELAEEIKRNGYNPRISGKSFVFSGFKITPYELEDYIFNHMGDIDSSVTKNTSGVIAYTNSIVTPKILSARSLGIPIYTQQEFRERIMNIS